LKLSIGLLASLMMMMMGQRPSSRELSEFAPTGRMRVGINFGNALLVNKNAKGDPGGIAVDLARELGQRLGVPIEIVGFDSAGRMADGAKSGAWDIAFLGADPDRSNEIEFTAPYLEVDTTYLVPPGSSLQTIADVDRAGVRIAVSEKSAYDLFLTRTLNRAQLVRVPGVDASVDLYLTRKLDALAGLKPLLLETAKEQPGSRVLEGRFTVVQQAVGTPKSREAAAKYLRNFIEDVKASGLAAGIIEKNGVRGVTVAPRALVP
jgi:polar amino acid transport system substrate-binding protein